MDGNNSLKQVATPARGHANPHPRKFKSDYFLSPEYVNQYANEVQSRKEKTARTQLDEDNSEDEDDDVTDGPEGDPTDGQTMQELSDCVKNWKSAASEDKKKMWAIFEETGILACACCHGFILLITDMVRSSEL